MPNVPSGHGSAGLPKRCERSQLCLRGRKLSSRVSRSSPARLRFARARYGRAMTRSSRSELSVRSPLAAGRDRRLAVAETASPRRCATACQSELSRSSVLRSRARSANRARCSGTGIQAHSGRTSPTSRVSVRSQRDVDSRSVFARRLAPAQRVCAHAPSSAVRPSSRRRAQGKTRETNEPARADASKRDRCTDRDPRSAEADLPPGRLATSRHRDPQLREAHSHPLSVSQSVECGICLRVHGSKPVYDRQDSRGLLRVRGIAISRECFALSEDALFTIFVQQPRG